jgi:hypothetical protein
MTNQKLIKQAEIDIAICLMTYGDEPKKLRTRLEELLLEWFTKGIEHNEKRT